MKKKNLIIHVLFIVFSVFNMTDSFAQNTESNVVTNLSGVGDITQGMLNEIKSIKPVDGLAHSYTLDDLKMRSIEDRIINIKSAIISLKRLDKEVESLLIDLWRTENYTLRD